MAEHWSVCPKECLNGFLGIVEAFAKVHRFDLVLLLAILLFLGHGGQRSWSIEL